MKAFKTKEFSRLMRATTLSDSDLCEAVARLERGLIDAHLGKFLIKQRVARDNQGRSGGFRAVLFFKSGDHAIFLHLFAKNEKASLTRIEEEAYRSIAKELATLSDETISILLSEKRWIDIKYEDSQKKVSERAAAVPASGGKGSARRRRDR